MPNYDREERWLRIAFLMRDKKGWKHIEGPFYEYEGKLYDLSAANLERLDRVVNDTRFLVRR